MSTSTPPFPAPKGYRWLFVAQFVHAKSKKLIRACEHGKKAFCILVKTKV